MSPKTYSFLVIDDLEDIRELVSFILEAGFQCQIHTASSGNVALEKLKSGLQVDLIVSDFQMPDGNGLDVLREIRASHSKVPVLFLSGDDLRANGSLKNYDGWLSTAKPFTEESVLDSCQKLLKQVQEEIPAIYIPIRVQLLNRIGPLKAPLFAKINDSKYVRIPQETPLFTTEQEARYSEKGVSHLYIEALSAETFLEEFKKMAFSKEAWQSVSSEDLPETVTFNVELMRSLSLQMGWSPRVLSLAEENLKKTLFLASQTPQLNKLVQKFHRVEHLGFADHCILLSLVCTVLCDQLELEDPSYGQKLCFAALFHDMTLTEEQYDQKRKHLKVLQKKDQNPSSETRAIFAHPIKSADLVRAWSFCPPGVDEIILEHHENPEGTGFPLGKPASEISFLGSLFIVAEDFVDFFCDYSAKSSLEDYTRLRRKHFTSGQFASIFDALVSPNSTNKAA